MKNDSLTLAITLAGDRLIEIDIAHNKRFSQIKQLSTCMTVEDMDKLITESMIALSQLADKLASENGLEQAGYQHFFHWLPYETVNTTPPADLPMVTAG